MPSPVQRAGLPATVRGLTSVLLLLLAGCGQQHGDPVVNFEKDDPEMNAAMDQARQSLGEFLAHLRQHPEDEMSLIKAPIQTGEGIEHIWIDNVTFDGTQFTGTLANQPYDLSKHKQGDTVTVPWGTISDWLYLVGDQMRGGYTIEVIERRMAEWTPDRPLRQ